MKTRRTEFEVRGDNVPPWLIAELKKRYGKSVTLLDADEEESIPIVETDWYRKIRKQTTPGDAMRLYRENRELSQEDVAVKLGPGFKKQHVCDMERGRRAISKGVAKKLAKVFGTSPARFI